MCYLCIPKQSVWNARRAFVLAAGAAAVAPVLAQVDVGQSSTFRKLVPAEQIEGAATQQYAQMLAQARASNLLATDSNAQLQKLRVIAQRIIAHAGQWNDRARQWRWEINLVRDKQINAFCMPGGKIAFYSGILDQLRLSDDEVAMVMGHEMAHALREHARAQIGKTQATGLGLSVAAQMFGLGDLGNLGARALTQLASRKFSRDDEAEADLVGMELAARSGFSPQAGATLWRKMAAASGGKKGGLAFLSTHPSGPERIRDLEANAPKVQALYEQARKGG
ncbi:MAG: M48 family metallopeptidase [Rhodoferax sp.]|nr:M48 family metallopeptidase [Rhodoferax sp.]